MLGFYTKLVQCSGGPYTREAFERDDQSENLLARFDYLNSWNSLNRVVDDASPSRVISEDGYPTLFVARAEDLPDMQILKQEMRSEVVPTIERDRLAQLPPDAEVWVESGT